jgi:hypothetical protein
VNAVHEYGYLAVMRVKGGVVKYPDGESQLFTNHGEAVSACSAWIEKNELPEAIEKTEQLREAFLDGCTIHQRRIKQGGLLTPDLVKLEILDPDERKIAEVDQGDDTNEHLHRLAEDRYPEPTVSGLTPNSNAKTEEVVVWAVGLYANGEHKSLPPITTWNFGLPIEGVLEILNELARDGWTVSQVSEDRGLYRGLTNQTDSSVTTARYMLVRSITATT